VKDKQSIISQFDLEILLGKVILLTFVKEYFEGGNTEDGQDEEEEDDA
jgi:hypothetical protein